MYDDKGIYLCEIISQHLGESKKTQTPYFAIEVWPTHQYFPGNDDPEPVNANETRTVFLYLTPKTIDFVSRDLRAIGFTGNSFSELDPESANHQSLVGQTVKCKCDHETYEGKVRDKFQLFTSGGFEHVKLEPKRKRELDSLFGKALRAAKPAVRPIQEELGVPVPADNGDDSIPF